MSDGAYCCFCWKVVRLDDAYTLTLSKNTRDERQGWSCHRDCLREAFHESAPIEFDIFED
jgi:hypothetical protein